MKRGLSKSVLLKPLGRGLSRWKYIPAYELALLSLASVTISTSAYLKSHIKLSCVSRFPCASLQVHVKQPSPALMGGNLNPG